MEYYGYAGKILCVDLTNGHVEERPLDLAVAKKFLGGMGLADRIIYDILTPGGDPLSPEAPIIIGAGPLCGTLIPGSGKCIADYRRPIAGHPTKDKHPVCVAVGGNNRFGAMLKNAGYDIAVIKGRAAKPCYLYIGSDKVRIHDAADLWGKKDIHETTKELIRRHSGDTSACGVWTIGKAGENLINWAIGIVDGRGSLGRFGGGALLGSKNLKAVVTWGDRGIRVADPGRFMELCNSKRDEIIHAPGWGLNYPPHGGGPLRPEFPKEAFYEGRICKKACAVCFGPEFDVHKIKSGRFAGIQSPSFFWVLRDFAGLLKIQDWREMVALEYLVNGAGLDYVTCFKLFSFLYRLYQRGVITKEDTGGIELKMGDYDCYAEMLDMILNKKAIFGVAAEGWYALGRKIGMEWLDDFKMGFPIWKGGDGLLDARFSRLSPTTLGNVVFSKPQHTHTATHYFGDTNLYPGHDPEDVKIFLQTFDGIKWDFANRMVTTRADFDRVFTGGDLDIGRYAVHAENCKAVYNSLGICDISPYGFKDPMRDIPFLAEAYSAATGIQVSPRELKKCGERIWNLNKIINVREGFNREDDRWPAQWVQNTETAIPLRSGPSYLVDWFGKRVNKEELSRILDNYYDERGWDIKTGVPSKDKVQELGLEEFMSVPKCVTQS